VSDKYEATIIDEVNKLRNELRKLVNESAFSSPEVVRLSQKMDVLIFRIMKEEVNSRR